MFGFFELFGASRAQRKLDAAFRSVGVHPRLVPDAVKITINRQLQPTARHGPIDDATCRHAAELVGYLMHGYEVFAQDNGVAAAGEAGERVEQAIRAGDSPDARMILLSMHAGIVAPEVVDEYGLSAD